MDILDQIKSVKTQPEEVHVVLVERFSGNEKILPLEFCKSKFSEERWKNITNGSDKAFFMFPYNISR